MAGPPPTPASGGPIPPPLFNFKWVDLTNGGLTVQGISQMTQFWAAVVGNAGLVDQVAIIQNLHGDGTLDATGVLIVTKTNGTAFGYFATGTDAAQLSGILAAARIAAGSLPYSKLANAAGALLLGSDSAGPIVGLDVGPGLDLSAGILSAKGPVYTFATLPTPTAGLRGFVSDASVPAAGNFGTTVAGGGGNYVPAYADPGVDWKIG